jgi:hypothetical protein
MKENYTKENVIFAERTFFLFTIKNKNFLYIAPNAGGQINGTQ